MLIHFEGGVGGGGGGSPVGPIIGKSHIFVQFVQLVGRKAAN